MTQKCMIPGEGFIPNGSRLPAMNMPIATMIWKYSLAIQKPDTALKSGFRSYRSNNHVMDYRFAKLKELNVIGTLRMVHAQGALLFYLSVKFL